MASPRQKPSLTQLSATLSASSSLSGSTQHLSPPNGSVSSNDSSGHNNGNRFKHYTKPTVSDSPQLVSLCQTYIDTENIEGLAHIARNRGLPPAQRQYAWPLLLRAHPFVVNPCIAPEFPSSSEDDRNTGTIPYRRIENDIARYRKKLRKKQEQQNQQLHQNQQNQQGQQSNQSSQPHTQSTSGPSSSFLISHQQSTQSTPLSASPKSTASSGSIADASKMQAAINEYFCQNLESEKFEKIEFAIKAFCQKWHSVVPYESAMLQVAVALSDWIYPSVSSTDSSPIMTPVTVTTTNTAGTLFDEIFEQFMMIVLHAPAPACDGPYGPCDSPLTERISLFLSILRKQLPELAKHFDEEDVLSSYAGGDEWLLWWIKWFGAKTFSSIDRGRLWDMYLGWRPEKTSIEQPSDQIGVDPFWNVVELESTAILDLHLQHLFACLALLKSKKNVLMELDQSEIREYLCHFSKSKDIESVIQEAGEMYRAWRWVERDDYDEE
ncbi:hypothetical protein TRVA0_004S01662 [Trichomonascus vanleenenianus]|uniref:Oca5p n=1 Tax=Trichomonascus vanleenenianus TaxID=2268995 RepID=UPI003ECB94FD